MKPSPNAEICDVATEEPQVTRSGLLDVQVCVPAGYTDEQVSAFANTAYPPGTDHGWIIRRAGDPALQGAPERVPCDDRIGYVHVMLDA